MTETIRHASGPSRVGRALRVQLVGWPSTLGAAWGTLTLVFLLNLALFGAINDSGPDPQTGALVSIYIITFVGAISSINQVFPFTLSLSVIRRTFYSAFALLQVGQALLFGVLLTLCKLVEDATHGWGLELTFFGLGFLDQDNPLLQVLVYTVPFVVLGFWGSFIALVYQRWRMPGVYVMAIAKILVLGVPVVLVTWQRWWGDIGHWIVDQPNLSLVAGWPLVIAVVMAGAGYLTIRRATP